MLDVGAQTGVGNIQSGRDYGGNAGPDVYVAAPADSSAGDSYAGALYICDPTDGTRLLRLLSPNQTATGLFGSFDFIQDLNSDSIEDLVVGASGEGTGGRFYILSGDNFSQIDMVDSPNGISAGSFGLPVTISDADGDNVEDILIAASGETVSGNATAGRVYVYSGASRTVIRTLNNPTPIAEERFGAHVLELSDVTTDGKNDIAVLAAGSVSASLPPRIYFFSGATGAHFDTLTLPAATESFSGGTRLALVGDINEDGTPDLAVGDSFKENGALYIYSMADRTLITSLIPGTPGAGTHVHPYAVDSVVNPGSKDIFVVYLGSFGGGGAKLHANKGHISASNVDFKRTVVGEEKARTATIRNAGILTVELTLPLTITGTDASFFSIETQPLLTTLAPEAFTQAGLKFTPTAEGSRTASLQVLSDAPNSPTLLPLIGEGINYQPEDGNNKAYLSVEQSIVEVDLTTGDRFILASYGDGNGPNFGLGGGIVIEDDYNLLSAEQYSTLGIVRVSRATGERTILYTDIALPGCRGLRMKAPGEVHALVSSQGLRDVNIIANSATWLSISTYHVSAGSGPIWFMPFALDEEPGGTLLVGDVSGSALYRVDSTTGARTLVGDSADGVPPIYGIASINGGDIAAVSSSDVIYRINGTTGTTTSLSGTGDGDDLFKARTIAYAPDADQLIVYDSQAGTLLRVDPNTGQRTIFSGGTVGSGPALPIIESFSDSPAFLMIAEGEATLPTAARQWWNYK